MPHLVAFKDLKAGDVVVWQNNMAVVLVSTPPEKWTSWHHRILFGHVTATQEHDGSTSYFAGQPWVDTGWIDQDTAVYVIGKVEP